MHKLNETQVREIINLYAKSDGKINYPQLAEMYNVNTNSICSIMNGRIWKHINRPPNLTWMDRRKNLPLLTNSQHEIIVGSMLGDGSIKLAKSKNCYFRKTQCADNLEYLQWMQAELIPYSSSIGKGASKGIIHDKNRNIIGYDDREFIHYELATIHHKIFVDFEKLWYLRNSQGEHIFNKNNCRIKCVPQNINLTPLTLAIWYMDDGSNNKANQTIHLCTNSFTHEEVSFLVQLLVDNFSLKCNIYPDATGPVIVIHSRSYLGFMNIVKPFIDFSCFSHKIDISKYKELRPYKHREIKGVYFFEKCNRWRAEITIKNKREHLGSFIHKEEAIAARKQAEQDRILAGDTPRQFTSYLKVKNG